MEITQTSCGRHSQELHCLEALLKDAGFRQHNALVIGAGLDYPFVADFIRDRMQPPYDKWLRQRYSWEYLEVAAILMRLGKPWTVTVVDSSEDVCNAIRRQNEILIDDFCGQEPPYFRRFHTRGNNGRDEQLLQAANEALKEAGIVNRLGLLRAARIPQTLRERITVVNGRVENLPGQVRERRFEAVTMFNVLRYLEPAGRQGAATELAAFVAEGGIVAADYPMCGLHKANAITHFAKDYDPDGYIFVRELW